MQLRVHRLAVHVDALLGGEPVGDVAPRGAQRRLLQVRLRGQVLQVDTRAPRHRVRETEELALLTLKMNTMLGVVESRNLFSTL